MFDNDIYNSDWSTTKTNTKLFMHYWECKAYDDEYDGYEFMTIESGRRRNKKRSMMTGDEWRYAEVMVLVNRPGTPSRGGVRNLMSTSWRNRMWRKGGNIQRELYVVVIMSIVLSFENIGWMKKKSISYPLKS